MIRGGAGLNVSMGMGSKALSNQVTLSIGAHTVANNVQASGNWPLVTPSVTTQVSGSSFVLFVALPGGTAVASVSDNKVNTYSQVGTTQTYASLGGTWTVWASLHATGGSGHAFSLQTVPPSSATGGPEGVIFAVEVIGGGSVDDQQLSETNSNPMVANNVTTTASGDMLLLFGLGDSTGSPDTYTPSSGYTQLDQQTNGGNSMAGAVASKLAGAAGSYGGSYTSSLASGQNGVALVAIGR